MSKSKKWIIRIIKNVSMFQMLKRKKELKSCVNTFCNKLSSLAEKGVKPFMTSASIVGWILKYSI